MDRVNGVVKKIVIVRHGQTEMNIINATRDLFVCGRYNTPLTEKGILDAKQLSGNEHLKNIDEVYSSDISRAYETAYNTLPEHEVVLTEHLRERSLGVFEGESVDELKNHPMYSKYFVDEALKKFRHGFGPRAPKGENYSDVLERIEKFFASLDLTSEKTVAIFSHICVIRCILMYTLKLDRYKALKLHIPNCKPIVLNYDLSNKRYKLAEPSLEELKYI